CALPGYVLRKVGPDSRIWVTRNLACLARVVRAEHVDQIISGADLLDARVHRLPPARRQAELIGSLAHILGLVVGNANALPALVGSDEEFAGEAAQRLVGRADPAVWPDGAGRADGARGLPDHRRDRPRRANREDHRLDRLIDALAAREGVP